MAKLIRICLAGTTSSGKSFLLGGIKSVFEGRPPFKDINYKLRSILSKSDITAFDHIETDINNNIVDKYGTQNFTRYLCEIIDGANMSNASILFSNIPGEAFLGYLKRKENATKSNFTSLHTAFRTFLEQNASAKLLFLKIKNFQYKSSLFFKLFGFTQKKMIRYEEDLKKNYLKFVEDNYNEPTGVGSIAEKHFFAYLNYILSDNVVFCYNPTLNNVGHNEQTNLLGLIRNNIDEDGNQKKVYFTITMFDSCFNNPNNSYILNSLLNSSQYLKVVSEKINLLNKVYTNMNNIIPADIRLYWDNPSCVTPVRLIQELNNTGKLIITDEGYIRNVFFTSNNFTNLAINSNHFPGFDATDTNCFTPDSYSSARIPIGSMELILSILLINKVVELSQFNFPEIPEYELVKSVYFNN